MSLPTDSPDPSRLRSGERIGNFTLGPLLGAGGMGVVYQAQQHLGRASREVAIKLIHPSFMQTARDDAIEQFTAELNTLVKLEYNGIARVYDSDIYEDPQTSEQIPYIAMELIRGGKAITDYAHEHGLTTFERLELFLSVCQAMSHAHFHRIVHCDLKPANILVDHSGRPFVIDFGLAHVYDAVLHSGSSSVIAGTPAYMSPEQVSGAFREVSEKSDTYALGLILYELLTGHLPYQVPRGGVIEQFRQVITEVIPAPMNQHGVVYDAELEGIVAQALDKRHTDRMTVTALRTRLERYLTSPQSATTMQQSVPPPDITPISNGKASVSEEVEEGRRYACLIGTNEYDEDDFPLTPYPEANVDALAGQLEAKRIGNFDEVVRLKNPTR